MNLDDDYDNDGNNIVPCPLCLDVYCPSKDGGKCPEEDMFALEEQIMEISDVLGDKINELLEYRGISDNGKSMRGGCDEIIMPFIIRKYHEIFHHQLQKARQDGYNAGLADGTDKPLLVIEQIQEKEKERLWERVKEIVENVTPFEYGRLRKIFDHSELDQDKK